MTIQTLVQHLRLEPHPEGGYYRETYRSAETLPQSALPDGFDGDRHFCTAIYFLITENNFSALHRIRSDETWHFYSGETLEVIEIDTAGTLIITHVGKEINAGEVFQYTVKAGHWFGSRVKKGGEYSLVGCTVSPGFDFKDFEMAQREDLLQNYPQHAAVIREMTR